MPGHAFCLPPYILYPPIPPNTSSNSAAPPSTSNRNATQQLRLTRLPINRLQLKRQHDTSRAAIGGQQHFRRVGRCQDSLMRCNRAHHHHFAGIVVRLHGNDQRERCFSCPLASSSGLNAMMSPWLGALIEFRGRVLCRGSPIRVRPGFP